MPTETFAITETVFCQLSVLFCTLRHQTPLSLEAEEMETRALQAEPAGERVLLCEVVLENPLEVDGASRAVVTDLGAVLRAARGAGHDGVIIRDIADTPAGAFEPDDHIAVFDPGTVRILEVRRAPAPDPEPVW